MLWLPLMAACLLLSWNTGVARADDALYRLHAAGDATAIGVSALLWWGPLLLHSSLVQTTACPCNATDLNGLDRGTAGVYRPGVSRASDVASVSMVALVLLLDTLDVRAADESVASLLTDVVVIGEAVFINAALNEMAKIATARPRPLLYGRGAEDALLRDPDNYVSFYSAHTSTAFALGLGLAQTFAYRHPTSPWRFLAYAGAIVAGSGIGVARVASGKHFTTDVLVGAVAGSGIGLLIPWLHRRTSRAELCVQLAPDRIGLALTLHSL